MQTEEEPRERRARPPPGRPAASRVARLTDRLRPAALALPAPDALPSSFSRAATATAAATAAATLRVGRAPHGVQLPIPRPRDDGRIEATCDGQSCACDGNRTRDHVARRQTWSRLALVESRQSASLVCSTECGLVGRRPTSLKQEDEKKGGEETSGLHRSGKLWRGTVITETGGDL